MLKACKKCRREGAKLMLKGDRCLSAKCAELRRSYAPGEHGQTGFSKVSEFGKQLREKQKSKRIYGISESQSARYAAKASAMTGSKIENLVRLLEARLDNVVYRLGLASSRSQARLLVNHGHILVNDKKVSIPSFQVSIGDVIKPCKPEKFKDVTLNANTLWIQSDKKTVSGKIAHFPSREEVDTPTNESLIIEYYSR